MIACRKQPGAFSIAIVLALAVGAPRARASEFGPASPGNRNVRDFFVPDPGFYFVGYGVYYTTDTLTDSNGNKVKQIDLQAPGGPAVPLGFKANLDLFVLAPTLAWVAPWDILGGHLGFLITPTFGNTSSKVTTNFRDELTQTDSQSQFNVGDLYVQPVWLGWSPQHFDLEISYGFFAPVGAYDVETVTIPRLGIQLERPAFDNVGEGFWTHQFQGGVAVYPFDTKATGISAAFAYALHGERSGLHVTPGSDVTLDWAITQYLPLASDRSMLLDLGPTGDSQWQVTDDTGSGATPGSSHGQLHSVGGEVGFTYVPWSADLKVRYTDDVAAENRFKGQTVAVSIGAKL